MSGTGGEEPPLQVSTRLPHGAAPDDMLPRNSYRAQHSLTPFPHRGVHVRLTQGYVQHAVPGSLPDRSIVAGTGPQVQFLIPWTLRIKRRDQ